MQCRITVVAYGPWIGPENRISWHARRKLPMGEYLEALIREERRKG
jgi:hypothetical protein